MKFLKYLYYFFFIVFLLPSIYAVGIYENNGQYTFVTNTNTPKINISLFTPLENMFVEKASLRINDEINEVQINDDILLGGEVNYSFSLSDFNFDIIENNDNVFFQLDAFGRNNRPIRPNGDETKFNIEVDTIPPRLVSPNPENILRFTGANQKIQLIFSEPILSYKIYLNGILIENFIQQRRLRSSFSSDFEINLDLTNINDGVNNLLIEFEDIAQNKVSETLQFAFKGEDLSINMLTSKDDSSLKYFYDKNYLDFFENNIYSSESSFIFKLQTNKPAKCYYTYNRVSFGYFKDFPDSMKILLDSQDKLNHEFEVDLGTSPFKRFWLACQNDIYSEEVVYLNDVLGHEESLLFFKRYVGETPKILSIHPGSKVSYNPIDIITLTNVPTVCLYSLSSILNKRLTPTQEFSYHKESSVEVNSGVNNLDLTCFDKIGREAKQTRNFELDLENGVSVFPQNTPLYSSSPTFNLIVTLSEQADCRASLRMISDVGEFESLPTANSSDFNREFSISPLQKGTNDVFVYCRKDGSIFDNKFEIIFDQDGPQISNFTFLNNGIASNYVSSQDSFEFEFNVEALIPVDKYFVELIDSNQNKIFTFTRPNGKITSDLSNVSRVKVIAQNQINQNSSPLEKVLQFDLEGPSIKIIPSGNQVSISCIDEKSGCNKVFYGFSSQQSQCSPSSLYIKGEFLDVLGKNFICVRAIDNVGHISNLTQAISLGFTIPDLNLSNQTQDNLSTPLFPEFENQSEKIVDPFDPDFESSLPPPQTSGNGLLIISAIILLLASASGGGYYAYKKGYLDKQLLKYGIIKNKKSNNSNNPVGNNPNALFGNKKQNIKSKSSYDDHLRRLNDFVDHTLDNRKEVFDNFSSDDNKGKVDDFMDTLAKKPKVAGKTISKEDLDEFYESSSKLGTGKGLSLEEEAEKFEEFYRKKTEAEKQNNKKK